MIKESQVKVHEADQPDLVGDFSNAHHLAGEDATEVDFTSTDAEPTAAGHAHGAVVIRVIGLGWWLVDPG